MLSWLKKMLSRMTVDDILAIAPDFPDRVEKVEEVAHEQVEQADELERQATKLMTKSATTKKLATRKLNAVSKFRKVTQK